MKSNISKKNIFRIFVFLLILISPSLASAEEIFEALTNLSQVESVYVSGRFSHNMRRWQSQSGSHVMSFDEGFSSLYTYNCYSIESVSKAREILNTYLKKNKDMEMMMRKKEIGGVYEIYERFSQDGKVMQLIIWSCDSPNMCEIVVVNWDKGLSRNKTSWIKYDDLRLKELPLRDSELTEYYLSTFNFLSQL